MWDKETSKTKKPEETFVEGNTENSTSRYFKRNNLYENVSTGTDTVVVATYVVNDDDDCADYRKNVTDHPMSLETEQSDIDHLLSIVQLSDGPSTSSSSQKNELNQVPYSAKLLDLKSVSPISLSSISTAAKDIPIAEELTVAIENDELQYKNTNTNIKPQSSMQCIKPLISVKSSLISRKPTQNEKVSEQRGRNIPSDNVAGPQIQSLHDKSTMSAEDLDSATRGYSPASVEDLTSVSENRACSPSPSSVTSASTLRVARSSSGRRMECLRHMRRPPKEPEEYLDALFPHIRKAHNQIRLALLHSPLTDVKDNALLKKKMLELIQIYTSGCKEEFERVAPSLVLCRRLKRNIIRLLDLFHEICSSSREDHAYLYHISQLIAVYTSLEIRLSFNLTRLQKCALIHRISHIIHKHLMVKNESLAKENILRMFLHMPDTYSARFIMEPLFSTFLQEIPTSSNTWCQKELPDKVFVQYIIILHIWKEMLRDPLEQVELINRAQHFMCPTKTLHANPMYANHLPTIHTRKHAVKDILNSLKFFHDLRNAAICDDTLHDGNDDIEVVIDEVINTPFWDFGATYTGESKQQRNLNRRVITTDPTECVDLTQEDDQLSENDTPLEWLTKLKERAAERVQGDESDKVICLDSDSDGELFCGSIIDPSESYQDCDAVDTDYTSLDGSTSDDKLSEDEMLSGNGITPNGLRTYLAPRSKNQINAASDKRSTTCPPLASDPYERTRDCDGEGDSAAVGTKKSVVATVLTAEPTLPLIVNSFTVSGKQNMHLLNSPRFSLDIGPERLGNEDIEFHDTCDDERVLSLNFKTTKNHLKRADNAVANEQTARPPPNVGGYYEREVNNDAEEEDDEDYNSLPSTATSSTTTLGKVIYTQALLGSSKQLLSDYDEREENYDRTDCMDKTAVDNERINVDNRKQMLMLGEDKPVKKQVKFNDNPIGPTRRPHTKLPIKPAIHLSKIQPNNQQPIFSNSPQPRFLSPSSSTSSTTESLKQMAQKGRNFVNIIKKHKPKKILKSSSTIIIDSDEDDFMYVNTSANKKTNLVSTQPIQSKNTCKKGITNEHLSNRMCKMQACDVSNSTTMILGPKDISSTNNIRNKSVDIMHIITQVEQRDNIDSLVCSNVGVVEMVKPLEREEQNSNVSTTTGPNVDSNAEDESHSGLVSKKCSQKQTNPNAESTCEAEGFSAHSLAIITGSDICTSTSTDAFMQSTERSVHNLQQTSSNTESVEIAEAVQLTANSIGNSENENMPNENISKNIICVEKGDQCTNKDVIENMHGIEVSKEQELDGEGKMLSEKLQENQEFFDPNNDNVLINNDDGTQKNLSSSEKMSTESNCANSVTPETCIEINEMCTEKLKELGETAEAIQSILDKDLPETQSCSQDTLTKTAEVGLPSLAESLQETQLCSQVASDKTEASNTVTTEDSRTREADEPTVFDTTDTSDPKVILTDNTITLIQQSEREMVGDIVTSAERFVVDEEATHTTAENDINETQNTTQVALEADVECDSVASEVAEVNAVTNRGTTTAANVSENNIQSSNEIKSSALEVTTIEAGQIDNFNVDLEIISKDNLVEEKSASNQVEMKECSQTDTNNSDVKMSIAQTEPIEVSTEIFKPAVATSDGLVCLVEAVKAVEALTFTKQITEYIVPAESERNKKDKNDENETTRNANNLLQAQTNSNLTTDALMAPKTSENVTVKTVVILENSLAKTDACTLATATTTESNNIYFSGDKSPKTNLERLAEAAVQKYGEHVADRETCSVQANKLSDVTLDAEKVVNKSSEMPTPQTVVIGVGTGTDSGNTESYRDVNEISENETSTIKHSNVELNIDKIQTGEQAKSTVAIIDNIRISQPIDYDMHIYNLSDNVKSSTTACDFKEDNVSESAAPTGEYADFENISKIENNSFSTVTATGSTFHSHFESFLNTLTTVGESKSEVKGQRRSPRTQKSCIAKEAATTSQNVKSVVSDKKVGSSRFNTIKNILSKKGEDLVSTNEVSVKSLAQDSLLLSASSDSEFSNVGNVEVETRKRYSLRRTEQWKVVKNTSLRASPPASSAESMDTKKSVNNTLTTMRCIKIRLARAKVPTMAERKEQQPISTEQAETNLETEFGDVSHRPITRRLAAALNSSLQMVTENAVIEPIKHFARGRKSKSKLPATVAEMAPLKRRKCENVASTLRQNEKLTEANITKATIMHNQAITSNLKQKRKHCALEYSQKSHSEPPDVATILQNRHIGKMETISDDSTCLPEECAAKRLKMKKRKHSMKSTVTKTETAMQNAEFTFETVFVKPTLKIKNSKTANLSSNKANAVQQQSNEESETLIHISNKESIHDADMLVDDPTIEATIQKEMVECDEIQEKTKTNVLNTAETTQNSIKDTQLTEEETLANNDKVPEEHILRLAIDDSTRLNVQVSDEVADDHVNLDSTNSLDKIPTYDERVLEKTSNETSGKISEKSSLMENKEGDTELHKITNKSFNESADIRESDLKTTVSLTPNIESTSTSESDDTAILSLAENKKHICIKTIDSEQAKVESKDETDVAVLAEIVNKVDTVLNVFIRDSVSNTQEDGKALNENISACDSNEMVLGEDLRQDVMKTSDAEKNLTTNTSKSDLAEDINTSCTEMRVHIAEPAGNTQDVVTAFVESVSTDNSENINVLELDKTNSERVIKADRNVDTRAPILEDTINKDNTATNDFIVDSVCKTQEGVNQVEESFSTVDAEETVSLFINGEMPEISQSEKTLTPEASVSDFENDINKSGTETRNELETNTIQIPTKQIPLTNEPESASITLRADYDMLHENNEAPSLVDISNFTSLTLDSKTVRNFRDVSEFLEEDSNIDLSISHIQISDRSEYLNETESINTLKTNMEVDKLLEEYNHSARIIANANLKIPSAMQTPTDARTPACSSVTFSFTASDSSSSFTNSCSCSTTTTINSATDLYKNEPTSFKVVQSQAQVVELLSSTSTSFQDLSLLDLGHDVIMGNTDLLSEFIPTTMMDTTMATSLEHNYAIKPLETAIRNEFDIQSEANGDTEEIPYQNNETLQVPSLKVSIPIAYIKRFEEITDNRAKNWYLSEKPTTSKAALAALARRNAQYKTDIVHNFNTSGVSSHKQIAEPTVSESVENKPEIATTDSTGSQQLIAGDSWNPSPSLPLKKRRNISGVLDEDFCNATVMLSDDSDLVTMISQESSSNELNKLTDMTTDVDGNKHIEFDHTSEVETTTEQQPKIADNQATVYQTNTNYLEAYPTDITESTNEGIQNKETDFKYNKSVETKIQQQLMAENKQFNAVLSNNENENVCAINEKPINNQNELDNSNGFLTIAAEQQITEQPTDSQTNNDEIISDCEQNTRENIVSVIENTEAEDENVVSDQDLVRAQQKEVILQLGSEIQLSENSLTNDKDFDEKILRVDQPSFSTNDIATITQNITAESALQGEEHDPVIDNTIESAQNITDEGTLLEDKQHVVAYNTETDGTATNMEFQATVERNDAQADTNEPQIVEHNSANAQENLEAIEETPLQHALVSAQQELAQNDDCSEDATATDLLSSSSNIAALEIPGNDMPDLMTIQQIDSKDNTLLNFNDHTNEVILSSYDDQFLVTVCLNDADTVSGFEATNNFFASKEYTESDFDIGHDVIISTQNIKEESTEFMSNLNSPTNSPINLTKPLGRTTNAIDLNTHMLKQHEFVEFTSESSHSLAPTNSTNFPLFTMSNSEIVTTDLNVNNMSQFTNCELNIDHEDRNNRKRLVELSQMDELSFGAHESMQATQLPRAIEQVDQMDYSNFDQSITDTCNTDAFVDLNSPLKISTNPAVTKPTEHLVETHTTTTPTIKICSSQKPKPMETMEGDEIIAMPTILAQSQQLAKSSTLSPVLPLIKPTTTTINTIFEKSNTIFSFADIEPETTLAQNSVTPNNYSKTSTAVKPDLCATTPPTADDNSPATFASQSSASQLQTQTMRSNTKRARAPARVQIVTPQRKNREIAPKTSEEPKTPNIIYTNTTSFCSSVEFEMNQVAATIPVAYPATPPRYANLFQFEKYIQKLMTLIDVPGIIDSARNLFVDKQALAEAHAALLAQATQFDDEGNAISEPLLLKYHKDGTISILNDNDECIILTANMSKMVKSLSLALSILQEQQSPVLGIRARIHALLKQLTQTNATTKTAHVAPNINNPTVIPTAVVNPTNLVDNSRDNDINATDTMAYGSELGGEMSQQPPLQVISANLQNMQLYATNWQQLEDSGLLTQSLPNSELEIANKEQFIDIEALPFAAVEGAHNYEHAVAFNFDAPSAMLASNENASAQRFESAFQATVEHAGAANCNEAEHWQNERPTGKVSNSATHLPSCTDVGYEQNAATGGIDVNNDNNLHVVMIDHRDDALIESYAMATSSKSHAHTEAGSKLVATVSPKGEKSKKTVYQTSFDNPHARTQTHQKTTAQCSPKKLATKRVEKVAKAHCSILPASAAVTPQQQTPNRTHSKVRSMPQSNATVSKSSHTIHYRHLPQPVTANLDSKPSTTVHYKQATTRPQQQTPRISSLPTHFVASNANQLQQSMPHLSIDNIGNLPLFAPQYPQNSALSGGVGLLHNNNIRYLLATPHTRTRLTPASTALANSSNAPLNMTADPQETLGQYPYQLQTLQTPPTFGDNLKLNELQLQSIMKTATHDEMADGRRSTADADVAAAATTTNMLRSFRNVVRMANAIPKTDAHPSLILNKDAQRTDEGALLTTQQQQQQVQFVPPTSALVISSMQQKQEAALDCFRQELTKRDPHLQTELHLPIAAQQLERSQSKVERNERLYTTTITSVSPTKPQQRFARESQTHAHTSAILPPQQQRLHTLSVNASAHAPSSAPTSPNQHGIASRKRGRPRKSNLGEDMFLTTSELLQQHDAGEAAHKYVKLNETPKERPNASARHKPTHAKVRQILPTTHHMRPNYKSHNLAAPQQIPPPPPLIKSTSRCTQQELRPSFTSSAHAFHLIEHMVENISTQHTKSTATAQQPQAPQVSLLNIAQTHTTPHSQLDQNNHINAIATLFSSYKIAKPAVVSGAPARTSGSNSTLVKKSKYKAGPKSMHMSRKTMAGTRKNSTSTLQSPQSVSDTQSPTKRNHSTSPVSLRANSPVIIDPATAADPKLSKKCAVIMQENEEVINYKRQQIAFINELLEKQREMQRQRALKRQEFQNILKQKREEGKRLMAEISQIKKQQTEAHEKMLETQQSSTILNRKRLLVRERSVTFRTNSKARSRSTTRNRTSSVENVAENAAKEVDATSAAIMQSVIGDTFELAADAMPLSDGANSKVKSIKVAQAQDQKSTTSIRLTAGMTNEAANTLTNSAKTSEPIAPSNPLTNLRAAEKANSALQLCTASSDEKHTADAPNKPMKTNTTAATTKFMKTTQKAEESSGTEIQGIVVPTTSKTSFSENPKIPSLLTLAAITPYTRCARSMTPTRGVYVTTKQSEMPTEHTTDNLLVNCMLSSPTSSRTLLQRAPSLSPSIFLNRNRVEVRRSMQDPTSNTDFSANSTSWLLSESTPTSTKTLKVRLRRLQHLNMNDTPRSSPDKAISHNIAIPTLSSEHKAVDIALTETPDVSTLEFQTKSNKQKRVQLMKQQLKRELLKVDETHVRPVGNKIEIAQLQSSKDVACTQARQTAEGRISKVARRKPHRRPHQSNKKLRLLEKAFIERQTNKMHADLRIKDSTCDNADGDFDSKIANAAKMAVEDGLQCDRNRETKETVGDTLANDDNDFCHNSRQQPMEPSENVGEKSSVQHSENQAEQQQYLAELTSSDKHAIDDVRIAHTRKEPTTKNAMDLDCSSVSDKKHKRTHKHGAIVTQVVDVTPGRHVNDSLLGDLLLATTANNSAVLNDVLKTSPKLAVIEPTATELQILSKVNEPTVDATTFVKPNIAAPEGANDRTHIEITNEMVAAVSGLAMLANRPVTTTSTESCINAQQLQTEHVDINTPKKRASIESFSSGMHCVADPPTVIGLLNVTQTHSITSIDEHAAIDEAKQSGVENRADHVPLPNDTDGISDGEDSSSDCLLSQLSKRVHKMSDLESIVDATTVHVIKDATMTLMSFEATPTLPAYLLNGESRDVPTPPAVATPAPTPAPTPTADLTPEAEQPKRAPTPPLLELMVKENMHSPMPLEPMIREQLNKPSDSADAMVSVAIAEPVVEDMNSLAAAPQQALPELPVTVDERLPDNRLSPLLAQDQQLEEVNSPAPASAISTSDHEVSSTQELVYPPTKRSNANTLSHTAGTSMPTPIDEEAAMLVQNSQIDTTHHLPESSYYMRKRARKFSDEFTLCENKNENSTKNIMKQRRKTFSSESCLHVQFTANNTTFPRNNNEHTNSSATASTSNVLSNGGQNSGGSSPSTTTEPVTKQAPPRRRNHLQKRNNSQSPLTGRSRAGGSVGELNGNFVYSCSRLQPTGVDMTDMERCVVLPASAVVPPVNLGNIARTYSKSNLAQIKVFVPPDVEMCLENEDAEKDLVVATTTSKRGRSKSGAPKASRKQPKLESAEKVKAKKTATNITKTKTAPPAKKRDTPDDRPKLVDSKPPKSAANTKAPTRAKNVERASNRKRK